MTKSRLLVDYEIVEMSGTKLAIFKNGGEDVYVVNQETAYILNLLKKGFGNAEIVSELNSHYGLHPDLAGNLLGDLLIQLKDNELFSE